MAHDLGPIPKLETERLILRPFCLYDARPYFELATDPNVIQGTDMPHPLELQAANEWIISQSEAWQHRKELYHLVTSKETREIVGSISLFTNEAHKKADVGYWVAHKHWGKGYATEMVKVIVDYAFRVVKLNKLEANHLLRNPSSGNVLKKAGFQYEGLQRQGYYKDEQHLDLVFYGLLRSEWTDSEKK